MINILEAKVDLHIHTYYSDGQSGPEEIVTSAKNLGYDVIAITDHDNLAGISGALEAGEKEKLHIVPGIELATETEEGTGLHILGYDIDTKNSSLLKVIERLGRQRDNRNRRLLEVLGDMGYTLSFEELKKKQPGGFVGKPVIARALSEKGYIANYRDAFKDGEFLGSPQAKAVKKEKLPAEEAIDLINAAGGTAVLAHPIQTRHVGVPGSREFYDNMDKLIARLKRQGLGGLECFHPDQNSLQTAAFARMAAKYHLSITRGSDFHGADFAHADRTAEMTAEIAEYMKQEPEDRR